MPLSTLRHPFKASQTFPSRPPRFNHKLYRSRDPLPFSPALASRGAQSWSLWAGCLAPWWLWSPAHLLPALQREGFSPAASCAYWHKKANFLKKKKKPMHQKREQDSSGVILSRIFLVYAIVSQIVNQPLLTLGKLQVSAHLTIPGADKPSRWVLTICVSCGRETLQLQEQFSVAWSQQGRL